MKKLCLNGVFILIFVFALFIGTNNVNAETLTQADFDHAKNNSGMPYNGILYDASGYHLLNDEEHTLHGRIVLDKYLNIDDAGVINLSNATIMGQVRYQPTEKSTITIKGNGKFSSSFRLKAGGLKLSGNITFEGPVILSPTQESAEPIIIEGGTFNRNVDVNFADLTIKGGTFNKRLSLTNADANIKGGVFKSATDSEDNVIYATDGSIVVIDDGEFEYAGEREDVATITLESQSELSVNGGTFKSNTVSINAADDVTVDINGGTFEGKLAAGYFKSGTTKIKGGTFKTSGTGSNTGAIATDGNFDDLLEDGYMYNGSTNYTIGVSSVKFLDAREISVIHKPYNVIEGLNQTYKEGTNDSLTFRIDADYSWFTNGGKVFIDGKEINDFTSKSGSTIIILKKSLIDKLNAGVHTLKVVFKNGGVATTTFNVVKKEETSSNTVVNSNNETVSSNNITNENKVDPKTGNPKTGDNVISYVLMLGLSIIGFITTGLSIKKRKFD